MQHERADGVERIGNMANCLFASLEDTRLDGTCQYVARPTQDMCITEEFVAIPYRPIHEQGTYL